MGFFQSCSEALLHLLSFSPSWDRYGFQKPLPLSEIEVHAHPESAAPVFKCEYPSMPGYQNCNTPNDRGCWLRDTTSPQPAYSEYSINTDYEAQWPQGIKREYWLNVSAQTISPDGYLKTQGKVFNNTYPGPLIEACWGDDITIHVTNYHPDNGTTIHWHGIRQLHTNANDGVNGVTQCPIATNETFTYNFKATQYGHTWYHSHYSLQYPDGVAGPLLIHGPSSANYDEAWDPILVSDWNHRSAFQDFYIELGNPFKNPVVPGVTPRVDSVLFDGVAKDRKPIFSRVFQKGKRYLIRLINSSTESGFIFSIDNHMLEIVTTDLVPIHPFKNESIQVNIGQRYSVIVEANPDSPVQTDGNYWIRTVVSTGCGNISDYDSLNGIIRYDPKSTALPTSKQNNFSLNCTDPPLDSLVPVVPWQIDRHAVNNVTGDTFEAFIDNTPGSPGIGRWDLTNTPLRINFSNPTILDLKNTSFSSSYAVIPEDYSRGYVYLVITEQSLPNFPSKTNAFNAHPMHLHGHDAKPYNITTSINTFKFDNPPRRDVALLPRGGYLAIAFKPDNPGVWLMHCHIAWHASSGLALQILERQEDIIPTIGPLGATEAGCKSWDKWLALYNGTFGGPGNTQDDSGI
ncbi:multicopper oxidase-domain-containing protein [Usnea florida]